MSLGSPSSSHTGFQQSAWEGLRTFVFPHELATGPCRTALPDRHEQADGKSAAMVHQHMVIIKTWGLLLWVGIFGLPVPFSGLAVPLRRADSGGKGLAPGRRHLHLPGGRRAASTACRQSRVLVTHCTKSQAGIQV